MSSQVPEGYKQTEIGLVPEDWTVSSVGKEFDIQLGKMLDAEKNTGTFKPYLGNRAVQWGCFDISDLSLMAMSSSDMEKFCLKKGDLIVCEGGEVGRAAIWNAPIEECYYQKALHRLRALKGFNSDLMVAFLKYWTDFDLLSNFVSQTSIAHLTKERFSQVPLPVPSQDEQRAIAQTLSDIDALISKLDQLIAKKRHLKTATMQQLLTGKKRLPGFGEGKGYRQTEAGVIPEDWEARSIKDVAPLQRGFDLPTSQLIRGNYPVVYSNGVMNHHAKFMVEGPGVVTGRSGTIGNVHYISEKYWPHNTALWVTDFINSDSKYIYYFYTFFHLERFGTGSSVPTLNRNDVHDSNIAVPRLEEQSAIAQVLSDMDTEIAVLEARRDKTQAIKQGMMQELLTGRTRLV